MAPNLTLGLHEKQGEALLSPATEILYGGAAGGGKSHLFRVASIIWAMAIPNLQIYMFRRTYQELWDNHMSGISGFPELLAPLVNSGHCRISGKDIHFWTGSTIKLRYCAREKDVGRYYGAEIHVLIIDELTQWTWDMYTYLRSRVRLGGQPIPKEYEGRFPRILVGSNPGGVGHNGVKMAFVDNAPEMEIKRMEPAEGGMLRQYIPARLEDNPTTLENDPNYEGRLEGMGNEEMVRAMRWGIWDIVAGGVIDDIWIAKSDRIIVEPFQIPHTWKIDRSFDWGSTKPFSVGWWAQSDGTPYIDAMGNVQHTVRGDLFRIGEWYGWKGKPNAGLRMLAPDIAKGILSREAKMKIRARPGPADPSINKEENGNCVADDMAREGVRWIEAQTDRVSGWQKLRQMLDAADSIELPGLYIFESCRHWIRTLPALPRDDKNWDDVDSDAEDHIADETRYRVFTKRGGVAVGQMRGF